MTILDLLREPMKTSDGYAAGGKAMPAIPEGIKIAKLNANENQLGPSPKVVDTMSIALTQAYLYPFEQTDLTREAIAKWVGFESENICISNGSTGLICTLGDVFLNPGDEVIMSSPSYMAYYSMPGRYGAKLVEVADKNFASNPQAILEAITDKTKLVVIVNPNNPTGALMSNEDMDYYMANVPDHVITVFDEAYIEWVDTEGYHDATKYVKEGKNVIILRTFSKIFGLAGLRLGYAITTPEIARYLKMIEFNYGPNRIALIGARSAIEDKEYIAASRKNNTDGRNYIMKELRDLGFKVVQSYTSFVYFAPTMDTEYLINELAKKGVLIRDFGKTYSRVSVGRPEQNEQFIYAVKEICNN